MSVDNGLNGIIEGQAVDRPPDSKFVVSSKDCQNEGNSRPKTGQLQRDTQSAPVKVEKVGLEGHPEGTPFSGGSKWMVFLSPSGGNPPLKPRAYQASKQGMLKTRNMSIKRATASAPASPTCHVNQKRQTIEPTEMKLHLH